MLKSLLQLSEQLINPDQFLRKRYKTFLRLLASDRNCHHLLASLEELYYNEKRVDICLVRELFNQLSSEVSTLLDCLHELAPNKYSNLDDYYKKFDFYVRFALSPPAAPVEPPYILSISEQFDDEKLPGGKGLHLSQLSRCLDLPVPAGFIISTTAWNRLLEANKLRPKINGLLAQVAVEDEQNLAHCSAEISALLEAAILPEEISSSIDEALISLTQKHPNARFAVRSSAVAEDSTLSFAGQYRTLLKVSTEEVQSAYRKVLASKYSPEAICYRIINGLDDEATPMAVIVLAMINASTSGVISSSNPADPEDRSICVHSVSGLGDSLMNGQTSPLTSRIMESGNRMDIINCNGSPHTRVHLSDPQLLQLAEWTKKIVHFYQSPQDIEWSCDQDGTLYLLQARQQYLTEDHAVETGPDLSALEPVVQSGETASRGVCSGPIVHFTASGQKNSIPAGALLLCEVTPPSLITILPRIRGVIAKNGSIADHFSSVSREFGIPVLVQLAEDFDRLMDLEEATLDATNNTVYAGSLQLEAGGKGRSRWVEKSPLYKTLKMAIGFISPLNLVDPSGDNFTPENCRSFHDIIRFSHEKSVQAMFFHSTDSLMRKPSTVRLQTKIPLQIYLVDVGGGLSPTSTDKTKVISESEIICLPLKALLKGLGNPGINWRDRFHFDWQSYDTIALAGGIGSKEDKELASYCLISSNYLNVNMRFGYHFTLLDCLCGKQPEENYVLLRFYGGGGTGEGKQKRLEFICRVLQRIGFESSFTGELLDARFMRHNSRRVGKAMDMVGRLLGTVKLLDMILSPDDDIDVMVNGFFAGTYDFSKE